MKGFAERLGRLGTESAFEVAQQANEWGMAGNKVFPFHIGDFNIPTPGRVVEAMNRAIADGKTGYCQPPGIPQLRKALAEDVGQLRGIDYSLENVIVQPGGKPTIGKFIMAVMEPGDEVLYPSPGFPIYESLIEFHGGKAMPYTFHEEGDEFFLDLDQLRTRISLQTTMLIFNNNHNPTAAESPREELEALAEICLENDLWVLSDEAYFETRYEGESQSIASLPGMAERTVILYTFSKRFAMTGWRVGASIGPPKVMEIIGQLNVNDESCTNHFAQWAMIDALEGGEKMCKPIVDKLRVRRDLTCQLLNDIEGVSLGVPESTFYVYPDVTAVVERLAFDSTIEFQEDVLHKTGVAFCPRDYFCTPLPGERSHYVRFAYAGIGQADIREGLARFKAYCEA
ncbi:MAG: aminotransferase class I/II-fold pyridoxal phosphate-dependent enzyme [Candidatus Neomarinimicrobiota bacterium]|nr:aminotransferase class I/II-fold pyridoxal phosphate-dependent enzyme [Candidatus Neomarinimicrobiota bacterium]